MAAITLQLFVFMARSNKASPLLNLFVAFGEFDCNADILSSSYISYCDIDCWPLISRFRMDLSIALSCASAVILWSSAGHQVSRSWSGNDVIITAWWKLRRRDGMSVATRKEIARVNTVRLANCWIKALKHTEGISRRLLSLLRWLGLKLVAYSQYTNVSLRRTW